MKELKTTFTMIKWEVSMNKIIITLLILMFLPAFAACPVGLDKPCTANVLDTTNSTLRDKILPNPLEDIKKTDAFQPQYVHPYHENILNIDERDYNSNCQFGVCLPERVPEDINPQD